MPLFEMDCVTSQEGAKTFRGSDFRVDITIYSSNPEVHKEVSRTITDAIKNTSLRSQDLTINDRMDTIKLQNVNQVDYSKLKLPLTRKDYNMPGFDKLTANALTNAALQTKGQAIIPLEVDILPWKNNPQWGSVSNPQSPRGVVDLVSPAQSPRQEKKDDEKIENNNLSSPGRGRA